MSYSVRQPDPFGQFGQGFGQGLAQQLPKEIERGRLAAGLERLGQQQGLTPFQQFAGLAGLPGTNPQIIQSGSDLLKQQAIMQGYRNARDQYREPEPQITPDQGNLNNIVFGQKQGQPQKPESPNVREQIIPTGFASRAAEVASAPPAARENPLAEKYMPPPAWNNTMNDRAINEAFDRGIARTLPEAQAYANQQREFYEKAPESQRARLNYQQEIDDKTESLFNKQISERLEKTGDALKTEIPGELKLEMIKQAKNKVATGQMTPEKAAEFYSKGAHDLAKTQSQFKIVANRDIFDRLAPNKKEEAIKNLKTMSDQFSEYGSSEMFYNMLRNKNVDQNGNKEGFGLSPGAAALIAFPRSSNIASIIKDSKIPLTFFDPIKASQTSMGLAEKVLNNMSPNDSILAIAKELKDKHPSGFDEVAFFDYIRDHPEAWRYNPRLQREVQQGVSDILPDWGDLFLFPLTSSSSKAHTR